MRVVEKERRNEHKNFSKLRFNLKVIRIHLKDYLGYFSDVKATYAYCRHGHRPKTSSCLWYRYVQFLVHRCEN